MNWKLRLTMAIALLVAGIAPSLSSAQMPPERLVTGTVLSVGPLGFQLRGPDGIYLIEVTSGTGIIVQGYPSLTDQAPTTVRIVPGMWVTAQGIPTGNWSMRATWVIIRGMVWTTSSNSGKVTVTKTTFRAHRARSRLRA